jgi:hypothetical protein
MAYTRELNLDADTEERLISYIEDEITRHYAERGDYIKQIQDWQIDYNAAPSEVEGTFPFKGSATLIIPLAAINVEAIHSRIMTTAFAISQFVSCKAMSQKWMDHARPVEQFLDQELLKRVGIYTPLNDSILEIVKYGTGVVKTGYCNLTKTAVRDLGDGKEEEFMVTVKRGATVDAVPIARFLMPFPYQDPQTSSWCGEEHDWTPYELRQHENGGLVKKGTMEKLSAHFSSSPNPEGNSGSEVEQNQAELEGREPLWPEKLDIIEWWGAFDVEGNQKLLENGQVDSEQFTNGFDKEIVVLYCRNNKSIISIRYNWNQDLSRGYHTGKYFPVEHRWPGIGVCKQVEQFQREITTQHRQRIDNATLANCRMIKVSTLSKYGPDEPIFPGKMWFVDNKDDIDSFQLGEIYPSSYSNENSSTLWLQQRTGINEVTLGMPQVGTPGTATSDMARIQEGNKKFDFVYRNIKNFCTGVVKSTVLNIKQFGPRAEVYYEIVENGVMVKEFFEQDYEHIKDGLLLDIVVAGQQDNKLLDRQNAQQIAQMLTGYYDSMMALAQQSGDQALMMKITQQGMIAATEAMKQFLESFDFKNVDRLIVNEVLNGNRAVQIPQAGGVGGNPGNEQAPGVPPTTPPVPAGAGY